MDSIVSTCHLYTCIAFVHYAHSINLTSVSEFHRLLTTLDVAKACIMFRICLILLIHWPAGALPFVLFNHVTLMLMLLSLCVCYTTISYIVLDNVS